MKILKILILAVLTIQLSAQSPEKIYPNARNQKSVEYLKEQSRLWKEEINKNPKNVEAWYNYYYANRNIGFNDRSQDKAQKKKVLDDLVTEMGNAIPNTYEYHLCKWMNSGWDMKQIGHLEQAQKLGPDRPEHLDYSLILAEMKRDVKARDEWARKKYEAGQFSTGLLYYNYNVLVGLPQNSILITGGDNDTFPIYYLQSLGIRKDVTLVHAMLVNIDEYRKPIFKELQVEEWAGGQTDRPLTAENSGKPTDIVAHLAKNKRNLPVHLGLTANHCIKQTAAENLYLTGLSYLHSTKAVDNVAVLKKNFEREFALDYLDKDFYEDISKDLIKIVNGNYIVPMLKLYEHYKAAGDEQKAEWIKAKLLAVSVGTENETEVKKQVNRS